MEIVSPFPFSIKFHSWEMQTFETCCSLKPPWEQHSKPFPVFYLCWKFPISFLLFLAAFIHFFLFYITHLARFNTYPSNPFKVIPIFLKVDQVPIECPGEHDVQRVVVGHLARQDNAFSNCDIHAERGHHDPGGIYRQQRKEEKKRIILVLSHRDIVGLRDPKQWSLSGVLKSKSELFHRWVYHFCSGCIKAHNKPSRILFQHHPDEEGGKKRLEKSAADLKGSTKTFYQRSSYLNLLTLKSFTLICCSPWLSKNCSVVPKLNVKSPKLE